MYAIVTRCKSSVTALRGTGPLWEGRKKITKILPWLGRLLIATIVIASSCGQRRVTLIEKSLPRPNPTRYEFDAAVGEVKAAVQRAYEDWHYVTSKRYGGRVWEGDGDAVSKRVHSRALQLIGHELLLWKGNGDALAKGRLAQPGNEDDAYLSGQEAPFGESQVYFKDGQPLLYYADFHIHLSVVGPQRTRVEILTYDSKVASGVDRGLSLVHGPGLVCVAVAPTTVEEYQILLGIGEQLGAKGMSPLVTPGPNSPVRQVTSLQER